MLHTTKPLMLALLLATAGTAFAQETTTEPETDTTTQDAATDDTATDDTAEEAEEVGGDLSMGSPIDQTVAAEAGQLQVGQPYIREEFGDWALRCLKAEEGQNDPCQLYQLLLDENQNPVAEISMFPLPPGGRAAAGATIVAPLETLLTQQLTLQVDGGEARRYPFTFCNTAGCVSRVGFTEQEVNLFKRGNQATVRMVPAASPEEEVIVTISLTGFTAGFDNSAAQEGQ
ncbi:invasion associated locus B family protein [Yoonia sp. 208BN28-4]|uniref:invasion associated locus B family protein n=1 Tax=Yoonia sp. 208BN28-4 TaxID=3126505 RepID=UPI0030AFF7D8